MQKSAFNRTGKVRQYRNVGQAGPELENHFILRLLEPQAKILREDIRQGQTNIKDRLFIKFDYTNDKDDMRNGIITFDTIMYKSRLVDLPSILETWKTIDGKNFYKTADVCQMLMVKEGEDLPEEEDSKKKRRDPNKVEKKYLWPHGYTPPLKNVRKRRFRKTLKKKVSNLENLDIADIEKEVKRLLRTDNEAIGIKWEVVREEDEKAALEGCAQAGTSKLDKQQLFGELSSSEDELGVNIDEDEDSRLSVDDSQSLMNDMANSPSSKLVSGAPSSAPLVTEFSSSMFRAETASESPTKTHSRSPQKHPSPVMSREKLYIRLTHLETDKTRLLSQKAAQEAETATIENFALKQKFLVKLSDLQKQIMDKDNEIHDVRTQLA